VTDATALCTTGSCVVDAHGKATLTATGAPGYGFAGWGGDCSGSDDPLVLTNIVADRSCVASYVRQVTVTGKVAGGPTQMVSVVAPGCTGSTCAVNLNSAVTLMAPIVPGYRLTSWSGDAACTGAAPALLIANVTGDTTCTANYVRTASVSGVAAGATALIQASSMDAHADCSAGNACVVDVPGAVTLVAPPPPVMGVVFKGWTGAGCAGTGLTLALTNVTADLACTAVYSTRVTITVSGTGFVGPTLSVSSTDPSKQCSGFQCTVDAGAPVTIKSVSPDPTAFRFVGWNGTNCPDSGLAESATFTILADTSCVANYTDFTPSAAPTVISTWLNPTGWIDASGNPPQMTFGPVYLGRWECRTGRTATTAPPASLVGTMPWTACDGRDGTTPSYIGKPVAGDESGSYETDVRLHILDYISDVFSYSYYAHKSLNGAATCGSPFKDDDIIAAASAKLASETTFPGSIRLAPPFVSIPFVSVQLDTWSIVGVVSPIFSPTVNVPSLRHYFYVEPTGHFLLVRRRYQSFRRKLLQNTASCANSYEFGFRWFSYLPHSRTKPIHPADRVDCVGLVLNANGLGYCVQQNASHQLEATIFSIAAWQKLEQRDSFTAKRQGNQTCTSPDCIYLPD
jgi:hypothetical protein